MEDEQDGRFVICWVVFCVVCVCIGGALALVK